MSKIYDEEGNRIRRTLKCSECGKEITRDNFGIIHADYVCCNDIICQIATFDKIEEGAKLGSKEPPATQDN